ncbi:hypothetical protein FF011L_13370 [Roseimaritima multifibrata]|uniref:Uncharacterized protein n=1 Tax=Roseimaritima multifibrata TaxID=1930274 RepID=A0A517MCH3_9BACT|nr:hypothetical protein [Roseimaritima multifibrata]QDS92590.1 hypothetical protein FF011L_13370 [Roseimaritima multifibrata]
MGRISTFFFGMICGAGLLWGAMHYHVVRTTDGFYFVPKLSKNLTDPYVDVRAFGLSDWQQHRPLAAAIMQNNQSQLLGDASMTTFKDRILGAVEELMGPADKQ